MGSPWSPLLWPPIPHLRSPSGGKPLLTPLTQQNARLTSQSQTGPLGASSHTPLRYRGVVPLR